MMNAAFLRVGYSNNGPSSNSRASGLVPLSKSRVRARCSFDSHSGSYYRDDAMSRSLARSGPRGISVCGKRSHYTSFRSKK